MLGPTSQLTRFDIQLAFSFAGTIKLSIPLTPIFIRSFPHKAERFLANEAGKGHLQDLKTRE